MMRWILLTLSLYSALHAADWPKWRGPNGNGITSETVDPANWDKDGPKRIWKAKVGVGYAAAVVSQGRLFTLGNLDKGDVATLWCLDAETGTVKWQHTWPSPLQPTMYEGGPNSTPVVDGDRLFVVIKPARVVCLEAASGKVVWEKDIQSELQADLSDWGIIGAPLVVDSSLVLNYGSNGTVLDKATGEVRWTTGKKGASYNVPALARLGGEPTLMVLATNALVAVHLKDGAEQWRVPFGSGYFCHAADPIVRGQSVLISSADAGAQLIDFSNGQPVTLWTNRLLGTFTATAIERDGFVYGINFCDSKATGAELRCVEWATGKVHWAEKGFGQGAFLSVGDKFLLLSDKGELTVARVTSDKFELIRRDQIVGGTTWTPPILANGRLYVRNSAGDLVCVEVGPSRSI